MSGRTDTERLDWLNKSFVEVFRYDRRNNSFEIVDDDFNVMGAGNTVQDAIDAAMDAEERG